MNTISKNNSSKNNGYHFTDLKVVVTKYLYHWPLFLLVLLISIAGAFVYLQLVSPVYEIYATILVKDDKKNPEDKPLLQELNQASSPKNAETEIQILTSKNLIGKVVNDLQLWSVYTMKDGLSKKDIYQTTPVKFVLKKKTGVLNNQTLAIQVKDKNTFTYTTLNGNTQTAAFNSDIQSDFGDWTLQPTKFVNQYIGSKIDIGIQNPDKVADAYMKDLDSHLLDKATPTIGLFISDAIPERGENFLNDLIKSYNEASAAEEKRTTKSTIDFIDNRLASLTGELNHAEQNVAGYSSSQGLTDISTQSKAYIENVQGNDVKLNDVNVQLNVINGIESYVNSSSENENAPATIGITDPALNSLIEKLSQLQLKRVALLATTPETNPVFEPINKQISITKTAIKQNIQGIKTSLINTKRELESFNRKSQSSIKSIPGQERQFVDMKRQQSIKENLYVYLLQKREELALSYASTFVDARIVDEANLGDVKWPKKSFVFIIALLCGLGIPFFIIYFRNSFNNKITDRRDIERGTDIPILGELSQQDHDNYIVVTEKSRNIISEQFRSLRTNLNYIHNNRPATDHLPNGKKPGRVTIFTSSVSSEGKSFVSSNLAASLASTGKKTVILEMDLRKPKISQAFGLSLDHVGISELINGKATLDAITQSSGIFPELNVLGSGAIPDNPAELLEKPELDELFAKLRAEYDEIIIDSPPLHLVTDAMIIGRVADVTLYIMRQGKTGKEELDFVREVHEEGKLPNMNIVFNGITTGKYGYGYRYDNSYYTGKQKVSFGTNMKLFFSRF